MAQKLQHSKITTSTLYDRVRLLEHAISEVAVAVRGAEIKDPMLLQRLTDLRSLGVDLSQSVENTPQFDGYDQRPGYYRGRSLDPVAIAVRNNMQQAHKKLNSVVASHNKSQYATDGFDSSDCTEIVYPEKPPKKTSEETTNETTNETRDETTDETTDEITYKITDKTTHKSTDETTDEMTDRKRNNRK
eukprot:TRINITY_DN61_c0_g1_i6.p2 TRINITY_DN61_c0_g1~~TRINITY_DN61_c0_g1_i6.p2  ORF type:complete len:189 (-),score=33.29 TRINITY_DN61_c0_g1_i6:56-622(-)